MRLKQGPEIRCHCNYHKFPLIGCVISSWLPVKIAAYLVSIGPLSLLGISWQMVFCQYNIPELTIYFHSSAVYFRTFWQPYLQALGLYNFERASRRAQKMGGLRSSADQNTFWIYLLFKASKMSLIQARGVLISGRAYHQRPLIIRVLLLSKNITTVHLRSIIRDAKNELDDINRSRQLWPLMSKSHNRMLLESNLDIGNWKLNCKHHLLPCPTEQKFNNNKIHCYEQIILNQVVQGEIV